MTLYEFTVVLDRDLVDEDYDRLFEAGLDDASPGSQRGRGYIAVSREAQSMLEALTSAIRQIASTGLHPVAIEDEDLVSLSTIAERTGRTHESVRLLAAGKRGPGGFPAPLAANLFSWTAVADWFADRLGVPVQPHDSDARLLSAASHMLRAQALATHDELAQLLISA